MKSTEATELGYLVAGAVRDIAARSTAGRPVTEYAEAEALPWSVLEEGGWDWIGATEDAGGGGATLRDLVEVALVWGRTCIAMPLLESVICRRWMEAVQQHQGPVTVAVPRVGGPPGYGLAPFGALPDITVARYRGDQIELVDTVHDGVAEPFAPALRCAVVPWVSSIPAPAGVELGTLWAAESVGSALQLLELAVDYAKGRVQFGRPIGSFQAVKHRLADMHIEVQLAESAVLWASIEPQQAQRASQYAINSAIRVAQEAIQVHGAMGFTWELGLHFYLRNMLVRRDLLNGLWG